MNKLFCRGYSWGWCAVRGDYQNPRAYESMKKMRDIGCDWISICFYAHQDSYFSTRIYFDYEDTPTDRDVETAILHAKELGMKVCLKPIVNCRDGLWRARIRFPDDAEAETYWGQWFRSYTAFIEHYAQIAQRYGCEMFCVGCEMVGTEHRTDNWRQVLRRVRANYTGLVVYNLQHDSQEPCEWLDLLDVVGMSAYYPVGGTDPGRDKLTQMRENWERIAPGIEEICQRTGKPVLFMEIGCQSVENAAQTPWGARGDMVSEEEQAPFYGVSQRGGKAPAPRHEAGGVRQQRRAGECNRPGGV